MTIKLTGTDGRTDGQDHILSQTDARTKKRLAPHPSDNSDFFQFQFFFEMLTHLDQILNSLKMKTFGWLTPSKRHSKMYICIKKSHIRANLSYYILLFWMRRRDIHSPPLGIIQTILSFFVTLPRRENYWKVCVFKDCIRYGCLQKGWPVTKVVRDRNLGNNWYLS